MRPAETAPQLRAVEGGQSAPGGVGELAEVVAAMRAYLHLPATDHIVFALAVAVTAVLGGDPCWGMIVGPPSSAKTETIRSLDDVADEHLGEITPAGLLGWTRVGKGGRQTGMLSRLPDGAAVLATIADFSTLLAQSDRGQRDELYALLRRAYDGEVVREIGGAPKLGWWGRLTLLAAVTPAIDNYSSHSDALGPRWLYLRLPESTTNQRRAASEMARRSRPDLHEHREQVRALVSSCVAHARQRAGEVVVPEDAARALDDAALVACLGRAAVERDGYRREVRSLPTIEEPGRLAGQLAALAHGALALGLGEDEAVALCRRCALDSIPQIRRRVLTVLASGEELSISEIGRRAHADRKLVRIALEDLASVALCTGGAEDEEDDENSTSSRKPWRLDGDDAVLVAGVLATEAAERETRP